MELKLRFSQDEPDHFHYMTLSLDGTSMPHTVYTFLSRVDQGLYYQSGYAFHSNAYHIVFASLLFEEYPDSLRRWESSGYGQLTFLEYSDNVPHERYTVGFSGLSSSMYINTRDNTELHGNIRDPCFGKVTRGWEVVDRMHSSSGILEENDWKEIQPGPVMVEWIHIL